MAFGSVLTPDVVRLFFNCFFFCFFVFLDGVAHLEKMISKFFQQCGWELSDDLSVIELAHHHIVQLMCDQDTALVDMMVVSLALWRCVCVCVCVRMCVCACMRMVCMCVILVLLLLFLLYINMCSSSCHYCCG